MNAFKQVDENGNLITPWVKCDMFEEDHCNIHDEHVHDCECPALEVWRAAGLCPYSDESTSEVAQWVISQ